MELREVYAPSVGPLDRDRAVASRLRRLGDRELGFAAGQHCSGVPSCRSSGEQDHRAVGLSTSARRADRAGKRFAVLNRSKNREHAHNRALTPVRDRASQDGESRRGERQPPGGVRRGHGCSSPARQHDRRDCNHEDRRTSAHLSETTQLIEARHAHRAPRLRIDRAGAAGSPLHGRLAVRATQLDGVPQARRRVDGRHW